MDLVSVGFLLVVVVIGAVIALIADNLGRTIGKKRLRFLHLRPRHTAMFFTAGAGLAIALVTILLVAAFSSEVRQWILEGRRAIGEVKELQTERTKLRSEIDKQAQELGRVRTARAESERQLETVRTSNQRLHDQQRRLNEQMTAAKGAIGDARRNLAQAQSMLRRTLADLRTNKTSLAEAQSDLNQTTATLKTAASQLDEANRRAVELDRQILEYERQVRELNSAKGTLETDIAALRSEFEKERIENEKELAQVRQDLAEAKSAVSTTNEELRQLQIALIALRNVNESSRTRPMMFALGDEVTRVVVPPNQPNSGARNYLNSLLRSARVNAEARGAVGSPSARLVGSQDRTPEEEASRLVAEIAGKPESRLLVASSVVNAFAGEPVAVEVSIHPHRKAFEADEVVAEVRIDGDMTPAQILNALTGFLSGPVKERAVARGMIPVRGAEASLGVITPGQVIDLVFSILEQNRTVRLQAVTTEEIFTGDDLRLSFRIR